MKKTYLFLQVGNDENRYVSKEDLYFEASKYLKKKIYTANLKDAVEAVKTKCKDRLIFIVRKLLCVWRC